MFGTNGSIVEILGSRLDTHALWTCRRQPADPHELERWVRSEAEKGPWVGRYGFLADSRVHLQAGLAQNIDDKAHATT